MQTLWSRVAQVRGSCRCPQCLSTANGVSRRATGTATRRVPRYLTTSTLWYSGIFAAAATFDAGIKKDRREQWDRAIADVKQELEQAATTPHFQHQETSEAVRLDLPDAATQFKPFDTSTGSDDAFQHIDPDATQPYWPVNTGAALRLDHLPPESIYATKFRKHRLDIKPLSAKKVATVETSVEVLLAEIFLEIESRGWSSEAAKVVPAEFSKFLLLSQSELATRVVCKRAAIEQVKQRNETHFEQHPVDTDDHRLCHFQQYEGNLEQANRSVRDLNSSLLHLFRLHAQGEINKPSLLAKASYNLSRCSGPPNLRTFNTLMLGFSAMEEPMLVDKVIEATRTAAMRPNEVTLATILKHYTKTDRPELFVRWVELMRGKHGGLALARSDIEITGGRSRLIRKPEAPDKIIQLPYATPYVFGPLVAGVLKFAGFQTALSICQNMGMEGWGLCMSGLTPLLNDCAERADWAAGLAVWNQIQALKASSRRRKGSGWLYERIKLSTFAAMLRLCVRCDQQEYFDSVWSRAVRVHEDSADKLVELVRNDAKGQASEDILNTTPDGVGVQRERIHSSEDDISLQLGYTDDTRLIAEGLDLGQSSGYQQQAQVASEAVHELFEDSSNASEVMNDIPPDSPMRSSMSRLSELRLAKKSDAKLGLRESTPQKPELLEDQLWGLLPAGDDLNNYELRERPMSLSV